MTIIELGLLASLSIYNTPFDRQQALFPYLRLEQQKSVAFYAIENGARCHPWAPMVWNPVTAYWSVKGGVRAWGVSIAVGHISEHGVEKIEKATESMDFAEVKYSVKFE